MRSIVAIDFACNDPDNGLFAGRAGMAQYGDCELESPDVYGGYKFTELDGAIRIHRRVFRTDSPSREWVGNWCWNRYFFRRDEAKRLLLTLRANGWRCTCGPIHWFDWFNTPTSAPARGEPAPASPPFPAGAGEHLTAAHANTLPHRSNSRQPVTEPCAITGQYVGDSLMSERMG